MSKRIALGVGITVLAVSFAGAAIAHQKSGKHMRGHHGGMMSVMKNADADKDGTITKDELDKSYEAKFNKYDLNKDGTVTAEEVQKKMSERFEKRAKKMTRRFDKNRDGKVTKEEFMENAADRLYRMDLNDDGKISKDEMPKRHFKKGWKKGGKHCKRGRHHAGRYHHGKHGYHHGRYRDDHRGSHGEMKRGDAPKKENQDDTPEAEAPAAAE